MATARHIRSQRIGDALGVAFGAAYLA